MSEDMNIDICKTCNGTGVSRGLRGLNATETCYSCHGTGEGFGHTASTFLATGIINPELAQDLAEKIDPKFLLVPRSPVPFDPCLLGWTKGSDDDYEYWERDGCFAQIVVPGGTLGEKYMEIQDSSGGRLYFARWPTQTVGEIVLGEVLLDFVNLPGWKSKA